MSVDLSPEAIANGYEALFDERMRAAHLAVLLHARATREDRWPTAAMVCAFARVHDVKPSELGAFFGLLVRVESGREVWVDVVRGPVHPHVAFELMTRHQAVALGFMRMLRTE